MIRVAVYSDNEWAFGSIHYGLSRHIFQHGITMNVLPWATHYTQQEMLEFDRSVDIYLTTPQGYWALVTDFTIKSEKIIVIAHAVTDLHDMLAHGGPDAFNKPNKLAVTSKFLLKKAQELGVQRVPTVLPIGVDTAWFECEPAKELKTIGYASIFERVDTHTQYDLKRGYLAERCAKEAGLDFRVAANYHNSFVTMPGFYASVDCVIVASTEEGAGLPALEAGAAGRLVISTPVGHWPERVGTKGGHTVPISEKAFESKTKELLEYYKNHPSEFRKKCREIQQHATAYDWSQCLEPWIVLITTALDNRND